MSFHQRIIKKVRCKRYDKVRGKGYNVAAMWMGP